MSDEFRSLRHLTTHVDEQVRIFTQLQEAIKKVGSLLDSLPETRRERDALDQQIAENKKKLADQAEAQRVLVEQFRKQRQETQALVQKEQQERVTAREAYRLEQQAHVRTVEDARAQLAELQREIERKKGEVETLEKELASTVKAVLRR